MNQKTSKKLQKVFEKTMSGKWHFPDPEPIPTNFPFDFFWGFFLWPFGIQSREPGSKPDPYYYDEDLQKALWEVVMYCLNDVLKFNDDHPIYDKMFMKKNRQE